MKYLLITLMLGLSACCDSGSSYFVDNTDSLTQLMTEYNNTRAAEGLDPVTQGLDCNVYTVPTSTIAIIGATGLVSVGSFLYTGTFNQENASVTDGLNVLPLELQPVITTWFIMKCTGVMAFPEDGWHEVTSISDDGNNIYLNGLFVNNDGLHSARAESNTKFLARGVYSFELDFLQSSGMQQLQVYMDGSLLQPQYLFH